MEKHKIKNRLYPGRDALKTDEFYDLARLLIKAGYCVSVNTNDNAGNGKKITTLTFWEQEEHTDKNGNKRDAVTVVAENVQVIVSKRTEGAQEAKTGKAEYVPSHYEQNATDGFEAVDADTGLPF